MNTAVVVHLLCGLRTAIENSLRLQLLHDPQGASPLWCMHCSNAFPVDRFTWADGKAIR